MAKPYRRLSPGKPKSSRGYYIVTWSLHGEKRRTRLYARSAADARKSIVSTATVHSVRKAK